VAVAGCGDGGGTLTSIATTTTPGATTTGATTTSEESTTTTGSEGTSTTGASTTTAPALGFALAELVEGSKGLTLEGDALVKAEQPAYLALPGIGRRSGFAVEVTFEAGAAKAGGFLQQRTDAGWEDAGEWVKAGGRGVALFKLSTAEAGNRLRIRVGGDLGVRILSVRVLLERP
jgi:hypothetical protein